MKAPNPLSTIPEILEWCAQPDSIVERKDRLIDMADEFPAFEKVFFLAFTPPTNEMISVLSGFPEPKFVTRVPNRQTTSFTDFLFKDFVSASTIKDVARRRTRLAMCMDLLEPRDYKFLLTIMGGKFPEDVPPKMNVDVFSMAFPHIFPNE